MPDTTLIKNSGEFRAAFEDHERQVRISTGRLACWLVILLMPLGTIADWFMYKDRVWAFLMLRLLCSSLVIGVWLLHSTALARKHYPVVGMPIVLLPSLFMTWMVCRTADLPHGGAASPYYAALNLILLAVSAVGHWSIRETFFAFGSILCMYLGFVYPLVNKAVEGIFFINVYFVCLTGIVVISGNRLFERLRFREFVLRHELDKNKKTLEQANLKLDTQNKDLADTLQKLTEAESQLVQQEKMASLGVMSAGIIHEINNPLNYATTGLFTLRKKGRYIAAEQQGEYEAVLKDVEEGITRVKNIVSDLRMFTHPNTEDLDQVEAAEAVSSALRFLSNEWKDKVRIEQNLPEHQKVWANKNKLIHVFVNLFQNSLDAMNGKDFNGEPATLRIEGRMENGVSTLIVRDNGSGIAPELQAKIFDPFFTTKDVGQGMGLGLSICYRIMQESGGKISVRSEPGKFCEFTLEFPLKG